MYEVIVDYDLKEGNIAKLNWSGNEVVNPILMKESKVDRLIDSLNNPIWDIWLSGCVGAFILSRRYSREFVESFIIEHFLLLCVFGNTLILGLDGLVENETELILVTMNFIFTMIFTVEMIIKLYGLGIKGYCGDNFNIFDGIVVI